MTTKLRAAAEALVARHDKSFGGCGCPDCTPLRAALRSALALPVEPETTYRDGIEAAAAWTERNGWHGSATQIRSLAPPVPATKGEEPAPFFSDELVGTFDDEHPVAEEPAPCPECGLPQDECDEWKCGTRSTGRAPGRGTT